MSSLETIVESYGWTDYMDMYTGRIYELSKRNYLGNGLYGVPVKESNAEFVGYAAVKYTKGMEVYNG